MDGNSNVNNNTKGKPKIGMFVIIGAIIILLIGCGLLFTNSNNGGKGNNSTDNAENKNNENMELPPMENKRKEISMNDKTVQALYSKYHSSNNPVQLTNYAIETSIYGQEIFKETYFNNNMPNEIAIKLLDNVMNEINKNNLANDDYLNTVYEKLENEYKEFFGPKNTYKQELFQCFEIYNENNNVKYRNNCSETSTKTAKFNITKAEKEENSYIYIYEDVIIEDSSNGLNETYAYRWTFESQDGVNYYFLLAEKA